MAAITGLETVEAIGALDRWRLVLEAAIRAPSADNILQVRFAPHASGLRVYATDAFTNAQEPHRRVLILLSFGAIAENIRIALSTMGRAYVPQWFPDKSKPDLLLDIVWDALVQADAADPLFASIATRRTNRRVHFKGPPLGPREFALLAEAVDEGSSGMASVHWMDSKSNRKAALGLIRCAETERFQRQGLHAELFEAVRFEVGWKATCPEQLPPAALEVEPGVRSFFKALRHWSVLRALNHVGVHKALGFRVGDMPCRMAPHLGVIASSLPLDDAALAVGGGFQRLWLRATQLGYELQPLAASTILPLQEHVPHGVSAAAKQRLQSGWRALIPEETPLIAFRLGKANAPSQLAGRMPLESYLLQGSTDAMR